MERNVSMEELKKQYSASDMVKADCGGCKGCCDCCCGMGDSIVLDPLDVQRLTAGVHSKFQDLLYKKIDLHVEKGLILPHLKMEGKQERCTFLNQEGRCSIHSLRPGFCRLFPLGRIYENGSFRYFLQLHECKKANRSKVKVSKWLDTPDLKRYEEFVNCWHYFLKDTQEMLETKQDEQLNKELSMYILNRFYTTPFDSDGDFYEQFQERMTQMKKLLKVLANSAEK
ncbi:MAG: YkgJ family cysteine cluster protein [Blautia sp.]